MCVCVVINCIGNIYMCVHIPVLSCLCTCVVSICHHAVRPGPHCTHPAATLHPSCTRPAGLSPSDRLAPCQERFILFESCRDIKRGRSPARSHATNKLATSPKVRGNMTSQSSRHLWLARLPWHEGMDGSCCNAADYRWIHSPPEGNICFVPMTCYTPLTVSPRSMW